uniref:Heterokaryon incompatibility domain-containing protein n=1 Tax=Bionectria ochroleuca TaxID=29856 RepID=A0A0B7KR48_BIOOC
MKAAYPHIEVSEITDLAIITPILCKGRRLLVTPNCESALRHLHHKLTPRLLWIDAICINQKSTDEKNYQVQLMGEIYARAERVIIWLGLGVPDDEELFRKARRRGRVSHSRGQSDTSSASFIDSWIEEPKSETLDRISNNAWFTRVWTIQGMLLTTNPVFRIGHSECRSSSMYTYFLVKAGSEILGNSRFQMRVRTLEILQPEAAKSKALLSKVTQYGRTPETNSTELLSMILKIASLSEASSSRDKIYGILGLLQIFTEAPFPPVDYTRDDTQISRSRPAA